MSEQPGSPSEKPGNYKRLYGPVATVFGSVKTGAWRLVRPCVDESNCSRCGICGEFCPLEVIEVSRSVEIDWTYCKGCGVCADVCPGNCIEMVNERK